MEDVQDVPIPPINLTDPDVVEQIGKACQHDGFFQIIDHGVSDPIISKMLKLARDFFLQPESERQKNYSDEPSKPVRSSTSFNVKTKRLAKGRDFLRLHCYPLADDYVHDWPSNPRSFTQDVEEYCESIRGLALRLLGAISDSLCLKENPLSKFLDDGNHRHVAMNHYQRGQIYALPGHTDCSLITVLLQDDVPGLQVHRNGKWVSVKPIRNSFIVIIGDQMQVISNDRYKSVQHRAVVNGNEDRISIHTFCCPSPDAEIGPASELLVDNHPAVYSKFLYEEYHTQFWNRKRATECCLDKFKAFTT